MGKRENKLESTLKSTVLKLGGRSYKWVSPGRNGVPDQICIIKGYVWFVEVKTHDGEASPEQERRILELKELGCDARFIYGMADLTQLINEMKTVSKIKC